MFPLDRCRTWSAYSLLEPPPSTATEQATSRYDSTAMRKWLHQHIALYTKNKHHRVDGTLQIQFLVESF